jgi:hypothetical protein
MILNYMSSLINANMSVNRSLQEPVLGTIIPFRDDFGMEIDISECDHLCVLTICQSFNKRQF